MKMEENEFIELKKSTAQLKKGIIAMVAMLNKHKRGELFFGIKDDGTVVGQDVTAKTIRDISQQISDTIEPKIFPMIEKIEIEGKSCIKISFEGENIPYYADGRAYLRVADENKKITALELEQLILKKNRFDFHWDDRESEKSVNDINEKVLKGFLEKAEKAGRLFHTYKNAETLVKKLGLLKDNVLSKAGEVLFCDNNSFEVQLAIFAGNTKATFLDIKSYKGTLFDLLERSELYIANHMKWRVEFGKLEREEIPEVPIRAIREALVNSFCHRDFTNPKGNEIAFFKNRIEIYNPGGFPEGLTPEHFIKGSEKSILRNPHIAEVFYFSKDIERWGSGLERIYNQCEEAGVKVSFEVIKTGFITVFHRDIDADAKTTSITTSITTSKTASKTTSKTTSKKATEVMMLIKNNQGITAKEIAVKLEITEEGVRYHLKNLKKMNLIRYIGSAKNGHWELIDEDE